MTTGSSMGEKPVLTGLAIGIGVAFLIIPIASSGLLERWGVDAYKSIFLPGGAQQANMLINPYGLAVLEYGGKYAIVKARMNASDLGDLGKKDRYFQDAALSRERIVVYRGSRWTVVLVANYTLNEALSLSRLERIGREFNKTAPMGVFALNEKEVTGRTISRIVSENIVSIVVGMFLLYAAIVLLKAFIYGKREETGGEGTEEG